MNLNYIVGWVWGVVRLTRNECAVGGSFFLGRTVKPLPCMPPVWQYVQASMTTHCDVLWEGPFPGGKPLHSEATTATCMAGQYDYTNSLLC